MRRDLRMRDRASATDGEHVERVIFTRAQRESAREWNQEHEKAIEEDRQPEQETGDDDGQARTMFAERREKASHDFIRRATFHDARADDRGERDDNADFSGDDAEFGSGDFDRLDPMAGFRFAGQAADGREQAREDSGQNQSEERVNFENADQDDDGCHADSENGKGPEMGRVREGEATHG